MDGNLSQVTGRKRRAPAKVDRRRAPETATRILDAAEMLFSWRGFYGVSLREIAAEAGVQLALSHYHFGSKESLFGAVIERRAEEHAAGIAAALAQALEARGSRRDRREAIIRALIAPIAERSMRGGAGWKNYIRLLAFVANHPQEEDYVSPFRQHYDSLIHDFVSALSALHPEMTPPDLQWGFFFYQAATTHILVESGMLDRQSGGLIRSGDLDAIVDRMVPFFAAGFLGLGAHD
ncbi:TetR/AcrR family transcriptional regulator [Sphingobium sp.]|uniref:TetR/AcrR family transcriptional regulator n=1 Tax=Sphingobium sp. TaxID=1912891 RepID=UPI002B915A56|nr:TetR/AcrR family transcriptional regulator [Sphingobium sp.]HUD91097.1 TetR/AcrR family transcriptional regulator [Sphingobium sp.]